MQFARPESRKTAENTLPLINIVFLLLIFFMIAGRLAEPDPLGVTPPASASERPPGERDIEVHIAAGGQMALEGETIALLPEGGVVRMKADGAADAALVVAAMEALREAGIENLHLLTVSAGP
jgi:biopolymer transport protein ExbD